MFELLKVRRGRKAAVALISPLVERSRHRFGQIPESAWFDPYMVGFIGMLITLVANRATGGLSSQGLGIVQGEAWAQITGGRNDLIGEEMCLLSTARNRLFQRGCSSAELFLERLDGSGGAYVSSAAVAAHVQAPQVAPAFTGYPGTGISNNPETAAALWEQHFDAHICVSPQSEE
jgi:hypothetical protein